MSCAEINEDTHCHNSLSRMLPIPDSQPTGETLPHARPGLCYQRSRLVLHELAYFLMAKALFGPYPETVSMDLKQNSFRAFPFCPSNLGMITEVFL